jgi:hypothetical protein
MQNISRGSKQEPELVTEEEYLPRTFWGKITAADATCTGTRNQQYKGAKTSLTVNCYISHVLLMTEYRVV